MQRNIISASIAVALATATAPAFALLPSAFSSATATEIYISGSSAQEGQLLNAMRNLCNANTLDVYRQSNQFIYFCTVNPSEIARLYNSSWQYPAMTKFNIVVYKSSVGGSGTGGR